VEVSGSKLFRPAVHPWVLEEPRSWLAIRSHNLAAIQHALRLNNTNACTASEGLACLAGNKLFISAPMGSWALVLGPGLPDPSHDIDKCYHFIAGLSVALGHIEFFWRNRALSHHAWVQAECGQIIRAYAWAGETLWNYGPLTPAEKELRLTCWSYGQEIPVWPFSRATPRANTEKVHLLAQKWSLDPMAIGKDIWSEGHGITGELSHSICG